MEKQKFGEILFPMIKNQPGVGDLAGKITGMILKMDTTEIGRLIQTPLALSAKVVEAIYVLEVPLCPLH